MADMLSQDEIDELLNTEINEENETPESTKEITEPIKRGKTTFKPVIKPRSLSVPYVSPVLKSDEVLFNPGIDIDDMYTNIPVVRTIKNYNLYLRKHRHN